METGNALLEQIEALNVEISRAAAVSGDSSGAETAQAALITQLSSLMDVRVSVRAVGGVSIRTGSGVLLAGQGRATLEYGRAGSVNAESAFNEIWVTEPGGEKRPLMESVTSGELKGLVELRDTEAPETAARLGELMTRIADELNRAHNANSAVPPPSALTGRNVGQSLATAVAGFTGNTTIAVTNAAGVIQARADIVFSGATMTINGSAATPANFLTVLNTELGGAATASFNGGVLSLAATSPNGIAIADDATTPGTKAGRGFSHYFGLNDLVSSDRVALYDTGLTTASLHGFTAGETVSFRFIDANGSKMRDLTVTVPGGTGTVAELLTALNDPATGVGRYGSFSLDPSSGALTFKGLGSPPPTMSVVNDKTTQVPSGVSLTELFGIGTGVRASRADGFSLRTDINRDPSKLALAQLNLAAAPGTAALATGDGRGALLLADAGQRAAQFAAAGSSSGGSISVSRYTSELAGEIGGRAKLSKSRSDSASALQSEAAARQVAYEGVNLDEELVLMTTYQQAFNASARLIQAVKDMYDVLLGMV